MFFTDCHGSLAGSGSVPEYAKVSAFMAMELAGEREITKRSKLAQAIEASKAATWNILTACEATEKYIS